MKQKLCLFAIHQTSTSVQQTYNLNPKTRWYLALGESNRMKSAYFIIHPGKNPPPQNGFWLKSILFLKTLASHPPLSQFNRTFHNPTGRHYTNFWISPDIGWAPPLPRLLTARSSCPHLRLSFFSLVTILGQSYKYSSWHHCHYSQVSWWSSFTCQRSLMA